MLCDFFLFDIYTIIYEFHFFKVLNVIFTIPASTRGELT
jgi:hypothetical protein